jgi:hypothetical protein
MVHLILSDFHGDLIVNSSSIYHPSYYNSILFIFKCIKMCGFFTSMKNERVCLF